MSKGYSSFGSLALALRKQELNKYLYSIKRSGNPHEKSALEYRANVLRNMIKYGKH